MENSTKILLGLGSNIGNRAGNIYKAVKKLKSDCHFSKVRVSRLYETKPIGPKQRNFFNAALSAVTLFSPTELLYNIKQIEKQLGRKKVEIKWGPRKIDIDILFFGQRKINTKDLIIPHPEIANRLFVLEPLCEIAPGFRHPKLNRAMTALKKEFLLTCKEQKVKSITNGK
jgi:dihydroneopterin aldolase/2-amino-4-hydroxy-6-hydroxymethyldihydropteridine diphosphokinase